MQVTAKEARHPGNPHCQDSPAAEQAAIRPLSSGVQVDHGQFHQLLASRGRWVGENDTGGSWSVDTWVNFIDQLAYFSLSCDS